MAKYLDSDNGYLKQKTPISESSGSTDASKIIATNSNGQVDASFLPQDFLLDQSIAITFFLNG